MAELGTTAPGAQTGWVRRITRYQWLVFFVVWAGWSLDAADFGLYSLVLAPALRELLGGSPSPADIGRVGGIISTVGLLGWAVGGFTFGIIADYIGRVRTLALSILIFSVFTALQGLAQDPLQFGIFRFLAGVGTGAEIIVGIPFVAAAWSSPSGSRPSQSGARHSPPNVSTPRRTANSCASCRCNCSTGRTATARWSGCCSASAPCSRSGPATSGCRRSSAASSPRKA